MLPRVRVTQHTDGNMKITDETTVADAVLILKDAYFLDQLNIAFDLVALPEITYGQRIDLSGVKTLGDLLFIPMRVLKGMSERKVLQMSFIEAYSFGMSVVKELERMAVRDESTFKYDPTSEEIKAGFYGIEHGVFGIVDRLAQRLSISHEAVFDLPEKRVFAMLKIDFDNGMFQRRLNRIISERK